MKQHPIFKRAAAMGLALMTAVSSVIAGALAAEPSTRVLDSQGNRYTLSRPFQDTYTEKNCPYGGEAAYTVYVVEYGTQITCPGGMIFTGGLSKLEDQSYCWSESYLKDGGFYAGVTSRTIRNEEKL